LVAVAVVPAAGIAHAGLVSAGGAARSGPAIAYAVDDGPANSGRLIEINTATGKPVTVGHPATGLGLTPGGNIAYVSVSARVVPVDTVTGTAGPALTDLPGNVWPDFVATPDGQTVFVPGRGVGVLPINTATSTAASVILVRGVYALAISPDGKTLYAASYTKNLVTPINTATDTAGQPVKVGRGPTALAVTPDGRTVYVVNQHSDTVTPISTATR
jgi:YVTN family beta-propeller protein